MHAALAALAAVILLPAHASVIGSTPTEGDVLTEQPGTFSVVMNEEILSVEGAEGANAMQVTDASGLFYGDGCVTVDGDTIALDAELGAAGDYALTFQVVSADGHPVSDTIEFAFEPAEGEAGAPGAAEAPACGEAAPSETTDEGAPEQSAASGDETSSGATSGAAPATASADQGQAAATEGAVEGESGDSFPFIAIGVLAVLAVLAVIAYRANRLRGDVQQRDEPRDDEV